MDQDNLHPDSYTWVVDQWGMDLRWLISHFDWPLSYGNLCRILRGQISPTFLVARIASDLQQWGVDHNLPNATDFYTQPHFDPEPPNA